MARKTISDAEYLRVNNEGFRAGVNGDLPHHPYGSRTLRAKAFMAGWRDGRREKGLSTRTPAKKKRTVESKWAMGKNRDERFPATCKVTVSGERQPRGYFHERKHAEQYAKDLANRLGKVVYVDDVA